MRLVCALLPAVLLMGEPASAIPASKPCSLPLASQQWMQQVLDGWGVVKSDLLKLGARPLPWMIFFDADCTWHVSADPNGVPHGQVLPQQLRFEGRAVPIVVLRHTGQIELPGGRLIPARPVAFASPHSGPSRSFFIVGLPDLWRTLFPDDPTINEFFLGVASHELTHTIQIDEVLARVAFLQASSDLPENINDDLIEETYKEDADYVALFERERDLFFDAVAERDDERAKAIAHQALDLADERHRRFFVGSKAPWKILDGLFLNMEGVASWVQYELARRDPVHFVAEDKVFSTKGRSTKWSQGEGLVLMLLIDRFVPDWQSRVIGPELASPFDLLRTALEAPPQN